MTARLDRTRRGVSVVLLLVLLALLPLATAVWFGARTLADVNDARENVALVEGAAEELIGLTELRAALFDEGNWVATYQGVQQIGLPDEIIVSMTGIDMLAELADARANTDAVVGRLGMLDIAEQLVGIRSDEPTESEMGEGNAPYVQLERDLTVISDELYERLITIGGNVDEGATLIDALRVLEASIEARQTVALQFAAYFSAQLPQFTSATSPLIELAEHRGTYTDALDDVQAIAATGSEAAAQMDVVLASTDRLTFTSAVDTLLANTFETEAQPGEATADTLMVDIDLMVAAFQAATGTSGVHLDLVQTAGQDVIGASQALGDAAEAEIRSGIVTISLLAAGALLFALLIARMIGKPLRRLADGAQGLRDGDLGLTVRVTGPAEVRRAARAINEAADHLELAERQATALAHGDLAHPALAESAAGALGASLQEAVQTLAASLNEREEFRSKLAHEATHDGLTRLPNRNASLERLRQGLARIQRTDATLAVLFLDLDGFKDVNDSFGHQAGDTVLQATAQRLQSQLRAGDHVGRLGGDEFLVIAEPVAGVHEAVQLSERLVAAVSEPLKVGTTTVRVGASIGVAMAGSADATADQLLRDADIAVYQAKARGRGRVQLCDERLRADVLEQAELEEGLRRALHGDELEMHYQPIVSPSTAELSSLEALLRWRRPGHGVVEAERFIRAAERSDLMISLDQWVIHAVLQQMEAWRSDPTLGVVPVALNISGRFLQAEDFVDSVLTPLRRTDVDPTRLVLEVSENSLLEDLDATAAKLERLRAAGVRIAIDDFGTGYTSLAHLRALPIDILKIDRSFTSDVTSPDGESLVKLIIDTGHLLGADITAEGIETGVQAAAVASLGSDDLQGFHFSRPLTADKVADRFARPSLDTPAEHA